MDDRIITQTHSFTRFTRLFTGHARKRLRFSDVCVSARVRVSQRTKQNKQQQP